MAAGDRVDLVEQQHRPSLAETAHCAAEALDDEVDGCGERRDVVGLDRGEQRDAQLVAAELAVRLDVDDAVRARSAAASAAASTGVVEVDRRGHGAAVGRVLDERGRVRSRVGPAVDVAADGRSAVLPTRGRRARSIHSIWSASRKSVASAGVLYVWSRREFSSAMTRSSVGGIQRPLA